MDPDLKSEWVARLRSGQYPQTQQLLQRREGEGWSYCCLGVLCELAYQKGVRVESYWDSSEDGPFLIPISRAENHEYDEDDQKVTVMEYNHEAAEPDSLLREGLGLDIRAMSDLINMNDVLGKTFPEIADWIEANV
jgi:hypothetical protein